jgi:hypothetical protein
MQPDDEITKRYREMAREEPGAAMDAAILAASRRALRPSLSRRWGAPVSIAAVLVLAFGLTLEMRHEEPGIESSVPSRRAPAAEPPAAPAAAPAAAEPQSAAPVAKDSYSVAPKPVAPSVELRKERMRQEAKPVARAQKVERPAEEPARDEREAPTAFPAASAPPAAAPSAPAAMQAAPATVAAPLPQRAPAQDMNVAPAPAARAKAMSGAAALRVAPAAQAESVADPVARELERIAQLRAAGHDAQADKALDDFRRDHPGYRIPDAMWERVKPR